MNILIIEPSDMKDDIAVITDRPKIKHITEILKKAVPGEEIRAGVLNGKMGTAEIIAIDENRAVLEIRQTDDPPAALKLKLVIAVPRPKVFRRILQHGTSLGIKEFHFMRTWKTDKSYMQSPELSDKKIRRDLIIGLEQARDTVLPKVFIHPLFRPFAEDRLPEISLNTLKIAAHPGGSEFSEVRRSSDCTLAIGPEGGFTPFEIELLEKNGFRTVQFGERILRVETALPFIAGKLFS